MAEDKFEQAVIEKLKGEGWWNTKYIELWILGRWYWLVWSSWNWRTKVC